MFEELGGLFGWLLVFAFGGTIMNYVIKFVNKRYGKKINANHVGKKTLKIMMKIFIRYHKYFGFATAFLLLGHFAIEYNDFGLNLTGAVVAVMMIVQVLLGLYAYAKNKQRAGAWFITHRLISVLIVIGIAVHLIVPFAGNFATGTATSNQITDTADSADLQEFTLAQLAQYDGQNGNRAYIAYQGLVYDVTDDPSWSGGSHHGEKAGTDLTAAFARAPHGTSVLNGVPVVGKLVLSTIVR